MEARGHPLFVRPVKLIRHTRGFHPRSTPVPPSSLAGAWLRLISIRQWPAKTPDAGGLTRFVAQCLRNRVRLAISEKGPSPGLDASVRLGRTLARGLAEDFPAEGDSLDPALSAFGRLGLQRDGSTDRPPQAPALGVEARHQLHPALSRNPQLLQDRRFLSWDPPHFPGVRLAAGPLQQLQGLVRRSYSDTPDSMSGKREPPAATPIR